MKKQRKDIKVLLEIIDKLQNQEPLDPKLKDHQLSNNWKGCRELHIQPDWLLIYRIEGDMLILERTGSHAELFES